MITIVGMGIQKEDITLRGLSAVKKADKVFVRTAKTNAAKTLQSLGIDYVSCDDLYDNAPDFDGLIAAIARRLLQAGDCVYCVDGAGTQDLVAASLPQGSIQVIAGVDAACNALALGGLDGQCYQRESALSVLSRPVFLSPDATLVIDEVDDVVLAGELQLRLLDAYGDVEGVWVAKGKATTVRVSDLTRQKGYGADACYILPLLRMEEKKRWNFTDVAYMLVRLRAPDGCDWDKAQTHQSIRDCCIEEAYELVEAIDLDDVDKMLEETGDVLLQAVFHASMAQDAGEFSLCDMLSGLISKLLARHPHVFGDVKASNPEEALAAWEAAKAVEKKQVTYTQKMQQVAPMPALMRAKKVQKIAAKAHYDFESVQQAATKIDEELAELMSADDAHRAIEGGDLLFACVNVLRLMGIEPELALLASIRKFADRFARVEAALLAQGKQMTECTPDELWRVYDLVKAAE